MAVSSRSIGLGTSGMVMVRFCFLLVRRKLLYRSAGGSISRTVNVHGIKY